MLPSSWYGDWAGLKAVVLGLGKSGFSVADTLVELGVNVEVMAAKAEPELADLLDVIGARLIESDSPSEFDSSGVDFVVVSPGFSPSHPLVQKVIASGTRLITDIELAFLVGDKVKPADWIVITGTNGKTTTTELTAHMLKTHGAKAAACGNIGNPILDAVRDPEGFDYLVVELSSFQLHYLGEIAPKSAAFLNLAADHYDWHGDAEAYFSAKSKVFNNVELAVVYNGQDAQTLEAAEAAEVQEGCRAIAFTLGIPSRSAVGYVEEFLVDRAFIENRAEAALELASFDDIDLIGIRSDHMLANIAAASALARSVGVSAESIRQAIKTFAPAPHRIQRVADIDGVLYVDDSKATNAHAADASLKNFDSVVWIVGGLLKGVDPAPLVEKHAHRIRGAVVIGADTSELEAILANGYPNLEVRVISGENIMVQAVQAARALAHAGDVVLLAPAAASMDQFKDYQDRGNQFQAAVRAEGAK
jgi:UDP-N-acetylmuramoylalanine--D-glutamate ligase